MLHRRKSLRTLYCGASRALILSLKCCVSEYTVHKAHMREHSFINALIGKSSSRWYRAFEPIQLALTLSMVRTCMFFFFFFWNPRTRVSQVEFFVTICDLGNEPRKRIEKFTYVSEWRFGYGLLPLEEHWFVGSVWSESGPMRVDPLGQFMHLTCHYSELRASNLKLAISHKILDHIGLAGYIMAFLRRVTAHFVFQAFWTDLTVTRPKNVHVPLTFHTFTYSGTCLPYISRNLHRIRIWGQHSAHLTGIWITS